MHPTLMLSVDGFGEFTTFVPVSLGHCRRVGLKHHLGGVTTVVCLD